MDSCVGVEQDLDKAILKFTNMNDNTDRVLQDLLNQVEDLRKELSKQPANAPLTPTQTVSLNGLTGSVKQSVFLMSTVLDLLDRSTEVNPMSSLITMLSAILDCQPTLSNYALPQNKNYLIELHTRNKEKHEHRELHATVSRVGKSIDRHFIADYASVAPKAETFCNDTNRPIMEQAIAQHLYRQGLEDVGDSFVAEAKITGVERTCTFALLQRCAAALAEGEPAAALHWAERRAHELHNSPLPFTLHRMQALKLAREQGVGAAIAYARRQFPAHAARHERALQAAVCALAWCSPGAGPAPPHYQHLLDPKALGAEAAELFIKEACALLRLAPLSPLAGAVLAGCRVLPALHDIRAKMSHPHVIAAWSDDELPFEVDLGEDGGGYHSVFACPILRQQASEQNPPMRLLCGHVISRDALNKLAMGAKLKCPYCPMEQSPAEARQIYFS